MELQTADRLSHRLARDLKWRRDEMSAIERNLRVAVSGIDRDALLRAGVALLYAHWEGFVREASQSYLEFVASRVKRGRLDYAKLAAPFVGLALSRRIDTSQPAGEPSLMLAAASRLLLASPPERAAIPTQGVLSARSNLTFEVLRGLLTVIGIDCRPYETKRKLIDVRLVYARNQIAHGEHCPIEPQDFDELRREVLGMLTHLSNRIQNAAVGEEYLATGAPPAVP